MSPFATTGRRRAAVGFILVTAMLDILSIGLIVPVLPEIIVQFAGSNASAGVWTGVLVALWAGMQFLFSPVIGSLSDRFGRRPVILISTAGLAADWVLMALAPNLWWLAVGRMIGGVTSSSFTAVYAYLADITAPQDRARAYGLVGAAFGAGFVAGPALGGILGELGTRVPFWAAAGMSGLAFLYGLFILPESLPPERRTAFSWRRANPLGALRLLRSHVELSGLAIVYFLLHFAHHVFSAVYVLDAAARFGLGSLQVGLLLGCAGLLDILVQGGLVGRVVARIGDARTMLVGLVMGAVGLLAMGLAWSPLAFALALIPNAAWGLAMPTIQSLMTKRVGESEQGQLQGANNSVASIAGVASPLFFGWLYAATMPGGALPLLPGFTYAVAAAILVAAALVGRRALRGL